LCGVFVVVTSFLFCFRTECFYFELDFWYFSVEYEWGVGLHMEVDLFF
jgi:hypothetical protein